MGALALAIEDHDQLRRVVDRADRVRGHRRELGGLALGNLDAPIAELQQHPSFEHEEPVETWMHARCGNLGHGLQAHLHRHRAAVDTARRLLPRGLGNIV